MVKKAVHRESAPLEVDALRRLQEHPNIVKLLEFEQASPCDWIYMEPAQHDLSKALYDLDLPVDDCVFQDLARGLGHVHENHLAHCDVKSGNVLLVDGRAKLCDFGSARELEFQCLRGSLSEGTALWCAPECYQQDARQTVKRDIWALGCVYLEMLCRHWPWSFQLGELQTLRGEQTRALSELSTWVPEQFALSERPFPEAILSEVADILERCLRVEPAKRPTARELEQHFAAIPIERFARNEVEGNVLKLELRMGRGVRALAAAQKAVAEECKKAAEEVEEKKAAEEAAEKKAAEEAAEKKAAE